MFSSWGDHLSGRHIYLLKRAILAYDTAIDTLSWQPFSSIDSRQNLSPEYKGGEALQLAEMKLSTKLMWERT